MSESSAPTTPGTGIVLPVEVRRETEAVIPKGIGLTIQPKGVGLSVEWSDGGRSRLSSELLRRNCPCAKCADARGDVSHSTPLLPRAVKLRVLKAGADEECDLASVWPIGNYALGIRWGDGHDTGIYTFALLRELSARAEGALT